VACEKRNLQAKEDALSLFSPLFNFNAQLQLSTRCQLDDSYREENRSDQDVRPSRPESISPNFSLFNNCDDNQHSIFTTNNYEDSNTTDVRRSPIFSFHWIELHQNDLHRKRPSPKTTRLINNVNLTAQHRFTNRHYTEHHQPYHQNDSPELSPNVSPTKLTKKLSPKTTHQISPTLSTTKSPSTTYRLPQTRSQSTTLDAQQILTNKLLPIFNERSLTNSLSLHTLKKEVSLHLSQHDHKQLNSPSLSIATTSTQLNSTHLNSNRSQISNLESQSQSIRVTTVWTFGYDTSWVSHPRNHALFDKSIDSFSLHVQIHSSYLCIYSSSSFSPSNSVTISNRIDFITLRPPAFDTTTRFSRFDSQTIPRFENERYSLLLFIALSERLSSYTLRIGW